MIVVAACGGKGKSADRPHREPDPELDQLAASWTIDNHIITPKSYLADTDAAEWHGRIVAITANAAAGYQTPFQGNCKDASYTKRHRVLAEVAADEDLAGDSRLVPERFGLPSSLTEFKFVCNDRREDGRLTLTPILTIYQGGEHAMTCFSGVCYLLTRRR